MRRLLLLAALCMAATLAFAPTALAQSASADPCPDPDFPRETPDGCQASDLPDVSTGSASASAPGREGDPCGSFVIGTPEADECYRSFGLEPLESPTSTASPTASPSASASAEATASATALPETGGPGGSFAASMALSSLALLVAGGIFARRLFRR